MRSCAGQPNAAKRFPSNKSSYADRVASASMTMIERPLHAVHQVCLIEQKLRRISAVLSSDAGNQSNLSHSRYTRWLKVGRLCLENKGGYSISHAYSSCNPVRRVRHPALGP